MISEVSANQIEEKDRILSYGYVWIVVQAVEEEHWLGIGMF